VIYLVGQCDLCRKYHTMTKGPSKKAMMQFLRDKGWSVGKVVKCPECMKLHASR
jgi:hypothetical protein